MPRILEGMCWWPVCPARGSRLRAASGGPLRQGGGNASASPLYTLRRGLRRQLVLVAGVPCEREPSEGDERRAPSSGRRQRLSIAAPHYAPRPPSPTSSFAPPEAAVVGGVGEVPSEGDERRAPSSERRQRLRATSSGPLRQGGGNASASPLYTLHRGLRRQLHRWRRPRPP